MTMNNNHIFKEKLLERKKEIIKILDDITNEIKELSCDDVCDEGDEATSAMDSGRKQQIYLKLKEELNEIEVALKKIEEGTYGICEMCEEPINKERLLVKPYAKYCIICRELIEKEGKNKK
ncbi:RNA polymerase-binding protein DksA [Lebetimonas sp. JH292]|uniref:RNA polymerase-binding protein DksA n=1 Tax=Lebetimonas sp. JH292 TaxID=990068 RepID=UPI00046787C2|nr:RNA polymerase-binding protein DksA [Lebetimonas sp. JH292]